MPTGIQKPTRRYHKKSRTGCTGCRSRRIKCDETHPLCANCQRAGLDCHYTARSQSQPPSAANSPRYEFGTPSPHSTTSPTGGGGCNGIPQSATLPTPLPQTPTPASNSTFDMLDLSLMHHYTANTSTSLFGEAQRILWQIEIPHMARSSPLLMHGLLATAALHMAYLTKDESDSAVYTSRALYHHSLGLGLFNAGISGLRAENRDSPVLFTFGLCLVIWAYASPTLPTANPGDGVGVGEGRGEGSGSGNGGSDSAADLAKLLASLELVRGNKVIFELSSEMILSQPIGKFTMPSSSNNNLSPSETQTQSLSTSSTPSQPALVQQHPSPPPPSQDDLKTLTTTTLTHLRNTIATDYIDTLAISLLEHGLHETLSTSAYDMRQPLGWPALVDTPFWERVRRRKPSALVILAHYAVILALYEGRAWWLRGWAGRLLDAVEGVLGGLEGDARGVEWRGCLGGVRGLVERIKGS
ncbi:Zn(II)2Cys6 transcription factor [Aspergillus stella-maris]|uniref:Zn(II)2Cys6 transcription factor n=1 Tax=Aspergillus stella-maris TaxID=1810926 RepID=UPI003CCCE2A0